MNKDEDRINNILIELTDAIGFDGNKKGHMEAFLKAKEELITLIEEIDNAKRI